MTADWIDNTLNKAKINQFINFLKIPQGEQEFKNLYLTDSAFRIKLSTLSMVHPEIYINDMPKAAQRLFEYILSEFGKDDFCKKFANSHFLDHFSCFDLESEDQENGWQVGVYDPMVAITPGFKSVMSMGSIAESISRASSTAFSPCPTYADLTSIFNLS